MSDVFAIELDFKMTFFKTGYFIKTKHKGTIYNLITQRENKNANTMDPRIQDRKKLVEIYTQGE